MDALTLRKRVTCFAVASSLCMAASAVNARVVKITIDSTTPVASGEQFGSVGAYELLRGTAYGELDPTSRFNAIINDITLAPKNAGGKVEYKAQFAIHKPVDMTKASGVMVYNVPNRGNIAIPYTAGDTSFLWRRGDVVLNSAWQGDQPIASVSSSQLGIDVPIATGVTGMVVDRFVAVAVQASGARQTTQSLTGPGRDLASTNTADSKLTTATKESQSGVKTGVATIASTDFAYADCRTVPFPGTPDPTRLCVKGGFDPALLYELVRPAKDPFINGVGNAAMRDVISFFRYRDKDDSGTANPILQRLEDGNRLRQLAVGTLPEAHAEQRLQRGRGRQDRLGRHESEHRRHDGQLQRPLPQQGDIAELYFPGADGPLVVGRLRRHGARPRQAGAADPLPRVEHVSAHHGNLRRSGALVQPRFGRHCRHQGHGRPAAACQRAPVLSRGNDPRWRCGRLQPRHGVDGSQRIRGQSEPAARDQPRAVRRDGRLGKEGHAAAAFALSKRERRDARGSDVGGDGMAEHSRMRRSLTG